MAEVFRATQAFAYTDKSGTPRSVCVGDLISGDDVNYKGKEHLYEPVGVAVTRTANRATETASAAPGEVRHVAKKAPAKAAGHHPKPSSTTNEPKGDN